MSVLTINWLFHCHWRVAKTHQKYPKPCQTFEPGTFLINNKCEAMDCCILTKFLQSVSDNHGFWKQKITGCYVILLWQGFRFRFLLRFFVLLESSISSQIISFPFLGELTTPKRRFKINWPLSDCDLSNCDV